MSATTTTPAEAADEELRWLADGRRIEAIEAISVSAMARRLPTLVIRAFRLGWHIDRSSVALLLACQAVSAVLGAAGLFATTGTISALFGPGQVGEKLAHAAPSIVVIATAAYARPCSASRSGPSPSTCPRASPGRPRPRCCAPPWPPS